MARLRERLHGLAVAAAEAATSKRVRVAGQILLVAGLAFALLRIESIWHGSHADFSHVGWGWLAGALALAAVVLLASGCVWLAVLHRLGATVRARWVGIFLQAQIGKYIPGSLWQYAGRGALGPARGIPLGLIARSIPVELAGAASAAVVMSSLLLGWWGVPVAVLGLGLAHYAVALGAAGSPMARAGALATLLYAATWPLIGASFWMTARAFLDVPAGDLAVYTGAFAAAWVIGFVAVFAPGGLGVREAVLVALLRHRIGSADALVVALASRGVFTLTDLLGAAAGVVSLRRPDRGVAEPAR